MFGYLSFLCRSDYSMSFYLSQVLLVYLLPALLFGAIWATHSTRMYKHQVGWVLLSLFSGALLFFLLPFSQVNILTVSTSYLAILLLTVVASLLFSIPPRILIVLQSLTTLLASFMWAKVAKLTMLSTTNVINTELILNVTAIILGFLAIAFIHVTSSLTVTALSKGARRFLIVLLLVIAALPLSGEIILASMKLSIVGLDRGLLAYVSKVTNFSWVTSYAVLIISSLCLCYFYRSQIQPLKTQISHTSLAIERRKQQARLNSAKHKVTFNLATLAAVLIALLYWDLVASQPIHRSEAQRMEMATDGRVHIPIDEHLIDGKLHRFDWVASDGKVVRFFVIDRFAGEKKFGVVFDACMLCGDAGYAQVGDQVVCLACGVHIFIPSIGKPGGCNPIPMPDWRVENNEIVVTQATLESGLKYFSEVVEVMATDPVNGKQISNMDAEHSYSFSGKTYFFTSENSYETFREDPWKYSDVKPVNPLGD